MTVPLVIFSVVVVAATVCAALITLSVRRMAARERAWLDRIPASRQSTRVEERVLPDDVA